MTLDTQTQPFEVASAFPSPHSGIGPLLDAVEDQIQAGRVREGMGRLFSGLRDHYLGAGPESWQVAVEQCHRHPLRALIHQDPVTRRSFQKLRGYAGDAELLDLIYGRTTESHLAAESRLGLEIYHFWSDEPGAKAVRRRRTILARLIDETLAQYHAPRILAVAAGHLRKLDLSAALDRNARFNLVAIDQDEASLKEASRSYARSGITFIPARIASIITGRLKPGRFDLIYAAGLYDYLDDSAARSLTSVLFRMLNPGGRLTFANFLPDIYAIGYMKTFMDWRLIHRTEGELLSLAAGCIDRSSSPDDYRTFVEENDNIAFVELRRRP